MTTLQNLTQDIINVVYGQQDAVLHLNNERTLKSHFDAIDNFDRAINVLAMNNVSDRYHEVERNGQVQTRRIVGKESANKTELWNGKIQYTMYKSESAKYEPKKDAPKASIKASIKNIPSHREFKGTVDASKEFKPSKQSFKSYTVQNYHFYNKAIVLELTDPDKEWVARQRRELTEKNPEVIHLVFRYAPFTRTGKPNPYDGITQLRDFLKSQKFITSQMPSTLREALDLLVGYTVDFPSIFSYNYTGSDVANIITKDGKHIKKSTRTGKSDLLTVYSVFGDFTDFEVEFSK